MHKVNLNINSFQDVKNNRLVVLKGGIVIDNDKKVHHIYSTGDTIFIYYKINLN